MRSRDGTAVTIDTNDLVVGDIILLTTGMKIPADCILIEGADVSCDESSMTGEPDNLTKLVAT
jgi:Ca2+-transporting ATPase